MWLKESSRQWHIMPRIYQKSVSWQHVYVLGTVRSGTLLKELEQDGEPKEMEWLFTLSRVLNKAKRVFDSCREE